MSEFNDCAPSTSASYSMTSATVPHSANQTIGMTSYRSADDIYHSKDEKIPADCDLCILDDQRIFYIHHSTRSSHWEPPWGAWQCRLGLPYGWEQAVDSQEHLYYIDHIHHQTTYSDPRRPHLPNTPREVTVARDVTIGFGFVAAGQHPTLIQFVSPGGPSEGKLYANDEILKVDGVDVYEEEKEKVVQMVRAARDTITLTVQQAKRFPRRQCKVRFTDRVQISSSEPSDLPPPIPDVLRVFLENGQTRSFKYDANTSVRDVCVSLCEKLQLRSPSHFALAVEYSLGARTSKVSLLTPDSTLQSIAALPNSAHLRCIFRFAFVPTEPFQLLSDDPKAFDYYYHQCVNDVVSGRFAYEMRYEACIRLAALHIQQICLDTGCYKDGRISISKIEKEFGLTTFLPLILLENVKRKEIRKHLRYYMKRDDSRWNGGVLSVKQKGSGKMGPPPPPLDPRLLIRLKYIQIVSHLPSFGGKCFSVTFKESHIDMVMQIDPCAGVLVRHPGRATQPTISIAFELLSKILVHPETEVLTTVVLRLNNNAHQGLEFLVDKDDVSDLTMLICGYYRLATEKELQYEITESARNGERISDPPPYSAVHAVIPAGWNYSLQATATEKLIDFSEDPPPYVVASTFSEAEEEQREKLHSELPTIKENSIVGADSPTNNRLLKATDSLMIKSSKELHLKETTSPLLKRASNPTGRKVDSTPSDSSDTEDSSWSSPLRSPIPSPSLPNPLVVSFGLNSPDKPPHHSSIETLIQSCNANVSNVDALLNLFPGKMCTDGNIIDLTSPSEEERQMMSVSQIVKNGGYFSPCSDSPSTSYHQNGHSTSPCPLAAVEETDEEIMLSSMTEGENEQVGFSNSKSLPYPHISSPSFRCETHGMDKEAIEDFLRRSNSICSNSSEQNGESSDACVRRMSLKEFTGLDPHPQLEELSNPGWKESVTPAALLNSYSARRRSLLTADPLVGTVAHKLSPQLEECLDMDTVKDRIEQLRHQLDESMSSVPNESPKKRVPTEEEKRRLLDSSQALAASCKSLVRCASQPGASTAECSALSTEIYEAARQVTSSAVIILHQCDVYHAKLVTSEIDQVLASLTRALEETEKHLAMPNSSDQLLRCSTGLAASLTQLINSTIAL